MKIKHNHTVGRRSDCGRVCASPAALATALAMLAFLLALPQQVQAGNSWERFFGGAKRDTSFSIAAFPDGGTISVGFTRSQSQGDADILMLRLDENGRLLWQKTYGGKARDMAMSVAVLADGGFVTAAVSQISKQRGGDALIMRHDKGGKLVWKKSFGGDKYDIPYAIKTTQKGHIVVVGYTKSSGKGGADGWIFCLDRHGKPVWERTYGTPGRDWLQALAITKDGSITVAGGTKAGKNDATHAWVMRLDPRGNKIWDKTYNNTAGVARAMAPLDNGMIAIAGWQRREHSITGRDIWVAKLDKTGELAWEKKLGGSGDDHTEALLALPGGDIALVGGTRKNLAVITVRTAWMLRLNARGKLVWRRSFEGKSDQLHALASLPGGQLAAAGASWRETKGSDAWILTLNKNGSRGRRQKNQTLQRKSSLH